MRTSCIRLRAKARIAVLYEDFLEICNGNMLAAMLLAILVYWTDVKLGKKDSNLWIWKSHTDFQEDLMFDKPGMKPPHRTTIKSALDLLVEKKFIERRKNPKMPLDQTKQYLVDQIAVQAAIDALPPIVVLPTLESRNSDNATSNNQQSLSENQQCNDEKPTSNTNDYSPVITDPEITEEEGEGTNAPMPPNVIAITESAKQRAFRATQNVTSVTDSENGSHSQSDRPSGKHPVVNVEETFASQHVDPDETVKHGAIKVGDTNGHLSQPAHPDVASSAAVRDVGHMAASERGDALRPAAPRTDGDRAGDRATPGGSAGAVGHAPVADTVQDIGGTNGQVAPIQQPIPTGSTDDAAAPSFPPLSGPRASGKPFVTREAPKPAARQAVLSMHEDSPRPRSEAVLRAQYEAQFWQLIEAIRLERGLKPPSYGKTWKAKKVNQDGLNDFYADCVSDEDIARAYKAMLDNTKDTWLRENFTVSRFFERLQGLLDAKPAQLQPTGTDGKPQQVIVRKSRSFNGFAEARKQERTGTQ